VDKRDSSPRDALDDEVLFGAIRARPSLAENGDGAIDGDYPLRINARGVN
jgi:hypothetical protein